MDDLKKRLTIANSSFAMSLSIWGIVLLSVLAFALAIWATFTGDNADFRRFE